MKLFIEFLKFIEIKKIHGFTLYNFVQVLLSTLFLSKKNIYIYYYINIYFFSYSIKYHTISNIKTVTFNFAY